MYQGPETGGGSARRPRWRIFYADSEIIITSWYVEVDGIRIAVPELQEVKVLLTHRYPIVKVAALMSAVEAGIAAASAAAYGSAWMVLAGVCSACTVAVGAIADYRKNPRYMSIRARIRGQHFVLYETRDKKRFGHVWRAMIRTVEDNRSLPPR
jgi:hypothetical protein